MADVGVKLSSEREIGLRKRLIYNESTTLERCFNDIPNKVLVSHVCILTRIFAGHR